MAIAESLDLSPTRPYTALYSPTRPYTALYELIIAMQRKLTARPRLASMFARCYLSTLETTVNLLSDGTTFVVTGDIPALWLRDSSAQVRPYIQVAGQDASIRRLIRGLMWRQAAYMCIDPYANAFNREPTGHGHHGDRPTPDPWVWERKFELDSLCYPIQLCYDYWQATHDETAFNDTIHQMLHTILDVMRIEQRHEQYSTYLFERDDRLLPTDTLQCGGRGTPTAYTGMVWSGFRPSDDACTFGFLIPANMFAVVVLGHVVEFARTLYKDAGLEAKAHALRDEIERGIQAHGVIDHPRYGRMYAYETDGRGNHLLMHDANVPSLLSMPYLGYRPASDELYQNTRRFVLSHDNPYYCEGVSARGVGSPHTPPGYIWPIALAMQGLTSLDQAEQDEILDMLVTTTAGSDAMHESFDPNDPCQFTRPWFAWANSLFAAFVQAWMARRDATAAGGK